MAQLNSILDQAALIFDHLYPHMPFKTDIYHFDHPSKFIDKEIRPHISQMGETDFHSFVIAASSLVRDAHTLYGPPSPYRHAGIVGERDVLLVAFWIEGVGWV